MMAWHPLTYILIAISVTSSSAATTTTATKTLVTTTTATKTPVTPATVTQATVTPATVTQATVTQAPVTQATVTPATVTQATATQAPVTQAPVRQATVTQAPVTQATATQASATQATATQAPVTTTTATKTPVTPATATQAPVTPATATQAPVTPAPVTKAPVTPIIPNTFFYNCTANGGIKIMNINNSMSNVIAQNINKSSSNCSDPKKGTDGSITVDNCTQNTTVTIVLEATHTEGILGGLHSKTFQIKCEDVNIKPYLLTVTAKPNIGDQLTQQVVHMVTNPTPTHLQSLDMVIKVANKSVEKAFIGQKLVIAIKVPDTASIKPTVCYATGNGNNVTLWQEAGCKHDEELFGEKWTNKSGEVRNTMYGFRFVGSSTSITITCTVRVCPDGYKGHDCDLSTCGSKKRKRITRLPETVTIQKATTTLTIRDPLLTSGAGRKAHELNIIIGIALATVGFLKITCLQG